MFESPRARTFIFPRYLINDQSEILEQLNQLVRDTPHFREAEAAGKLIRLSTGDGITLVFSSSAEAPVEWVGGRARRLSIK